MAWAQEKVEVPVINVGSKWTYRADIGWQWTVETVGVEKDFYVNVWAMPEGNWKGEWKLFYDKKNMNCIKVIRDGKEDKGERDRIRKKYEFPLYEGKKWKSRYTVYSPAHRQDYDFFEDFSVAGFEEVEVPAGKFRAIKVKIKLSVSIPGQRFIDGFYYYWWSPDVKAIIKEQKEMGELWTRTEYMKHELVSFELK